MPKYCIEISEDNDLKLRSEFSEPEALFKKVVCDAVQAADNKVVENAKPAIVRLANEAVAVSIEVKPEETKLADLLAAKIVG